MGVSGWVWVVDYLSLVLVVVLLRIHCLLLLFVGFRLFVWGRWFGWVFVFTVVGRFAIVVWLVVVWIVGFVFC